MAEKKRILVLDDSLLLLNWTRDALSDAGYQVDITDNVWAARKLAETGPDLVLMDVCFTDEFTEGVSATKSLKLAADTQHIPVILYSGLDADMLVALADDAGADGYINKTDDATQLVQLVTYYLAEAELLDSESQTG